MSSNYPPGVNDNTYGAPWNVIEIEKEVEITLKCVVSTTISGPRALNNEDEDNIIRQEIEDKINGFNYIYGIDDVELINIEIL